MSGVGSADQNHNGSGSVLGSVILSATLTPKGQCLFDATINFPQNLHWGRSWLELDI